MGYVNTLSEIIEKNEPVKMELFIGNLEYQCLFSKMMKVKKIGTNNYELFIDDVSVAKVDPNTRESPYLVKIKSFSNFSIFCN
jgi:hypothetical protein